MDALETFLGFTLNADTTYGSAIKQTLSFNAGDQFSFDWTSNIDSQDQAFVAINNAIAVLSTGSPYSYTFANAGNYQVAIGVIDIRPVGK